MKTFLSTLYAMLLLCGVARAQTVDIKASAITVTFDVNGLATLRQGDTEMLKSAVPVVDSFRSIADAGVLTLAAGQRQAHFDAATQTEILDYPWGTVACHYQPQPDRLNLQITVTNRGPQAISYLTLRLMDLTLPNAPAGKAWNAGRVDSDSIDNVPVVLADYGTGTVALAGETFSEDYEVGLNQIKGQVPNLYAVNLRTRAERTADRIHQDLPLPAGATKTYNLSLRFGAPGSTLSSLAEDLFARYAKAYPRVLKWPDRRPIAAIFRSSPAKMHHSATNPRGWMNEPTLDVISEAGRAQFGQKMLAWADSSVKILKDMNAQGMIFWDVEGEELPHPTTYIGDPRLMPKLAPEMEAVADALFKKFLDAGLRTGITIRPSHVEPNPDPNAVPWVHRHMKFDPVEEMSQKIDYAQKRWGCTLFYMDTNVTWAFAPEPDKDGKPKVESWPMRAAMLRRLAARHPDVLILPEFQYPGYYSAVSGYRELRGGITSTTERALLTYPDAFSVINVSDGPIDARHDDLVAAVKRGDILMFSGWYGAPANQKVKSIYAEAGK